MNLSLLLYFFLSIINIYIYFNKDFYQYKLVDFLILCIEFISFSYELYHIIIILYLVCI